MLLTSIPPLRRGGLLLCFSVPFTPSGLRKLQRDWRPGIEFIAAEEWASTALLQAASEKLNGNNWLIKFGSLYKTNPIFAMQHC